MNVPPEWRWLADRCYAWGWRVGTRIADVIGPVVAPIIIVANPRLRRIWLWRRKKRKRSK